MVDKSDATKLKRKLREVPDEAVLVIEEEIEEVEVVEEVSVIEEDEEGSVIEVIEEVEVVEEGSVIEEDEAVEEVSEEVTEVEVVPRRPFSKVTGVPKKKNVASVSVDKVVMLVLLFRFDRFARLVFALTINQSTSFFPYPQGSDSLPKLNRILHLLL